MFYQQICVSDSDTEDTLMVDTTVLETRSLAGDSCLTSPNFSLGYGNLFFITAKANIQHFPGKHMKDCHYWSTSQPPF